MFTRSNQSPPQARKAPSTRLTDGWANARSTLRRGSRGRPALAVSLALTFTASVACATRNNNETGGGGRGETGAPGGGSRTLGRFEGGTREEWVATKGTSRVVSETERVRAVIVSVEALAAFGKQDLVEAILGAGAEVWLLVGDEPFDPQTHPSLAAVRTRFPGGSFKVSAIRGADAGMLTPGVWARDYAPLFARTSEGRIRLLDLNYDTPGLPGDSAPAGIEKSFGARRVSLPISLEGGNFMIDEKGLCVSTERVVRNNAEGATPGAPVNGYTREALVDFYKDYFGCRDVMLVPTMPFEQTGHVDLYAKFLGQGRVAVADLYANEFEAAYPGDIYMRNVLFKPVKEEFLDARAKEFADRGYEVVRIPIGIPQYDQPKRKYRNRSYLNALFVNGTAIVPRYESWEVNGLGYKDARFHHDAGKEGVFLAEARKRYEEAGFKVVTVEASALAHQNGAVHCVTMQVPEGAFEPAPAPAPPRGPEPAP